MIQDIEPKKMNIEYSKEVPNNDANIFIFWDNKILIKDNMEQLDFITYGEIDSHVKKYIYLFQVGDDKYFLASLKDVYEPKGYFYEKVRSLRHAKSKENVFALMTAYHLFMWYRDNQFCGRCAAMVVPEEKMRALRCPKCGNMIFPKIAPAVIVGVTDKDRIIMTKYNGREYKGYALIAGFNEIGETAEQTIVREVMEEVGVHVKNIRYYGSQPWGMDLNLLLGYFAELDGDDEIWMDEEELSFASWYNRDEIDVTSDDVSLTSEMIQAFKDGITQTE